MAVHTRETLLVKVSRIEESTDSIKNVGGPILLGGVSSPKKESTLMAKIAGYKKRNHNRYYYEKHPNSEQRKPHEPKRDIR